METWLYSLVTAIVLVTTSVRAQEDYFWYVNDIHYDPTYGITSTSCNKPMPPQNLGNHGDFECDSPWRLVESAVSAMRSEGGSPKFIVWAGDNPPHPRDGVPSEQEVQAVLRNITALLQDTFPLTPIYPVLGDHDYSPASQLPPQTNPQYQALAQMWEDWINQGGPYPQAVETFRQGGYYTKPMNEVDPSIHAIVLNTNLYYHKNNQVDPGVLDPAGQFTWLEDVLTQLKNTGEMAHVFLHIPSGGTDFREAYNSRFNTLMQSFGETILGIYAGHYLHDSFRVFYHKGVPSTSLFISPSVSPFRGRSASGEGGTPHNPAIRKYFFDRYDYNLTNYEQFYLNLTHANEVVNPRWTRLYTFKQQYGGVAITPKKLDEVAESFKEFASEAFHTFYDHKYVSIREGYVPCDCDCKNQEICAIQNVDSAAYDACVQTVTCGQSRGTVPGWLVLAVAACLGGLLLL